jgi:hypothetical protein
MAFSLRSILIIGLLLNSVVQAGDEPAPKPKEPPELKAVDGPNCQWSGAELLRPAGPQCGWNESSAPNAGIFQCGLVAEKGKCVNRCLFIKCHDP